MINDILNFKKIINYKFIIFDIHKIFLIFDSRTITKIKSKQDKQLLSVKGEYFLIIPKILL